MTKNDSLILKGVALIFMVWHHLFWDDSFTAFYTSIGLFIAGKPIEQIIALCSDPAIDAFVFLSGYGLYKVYEQRKTGFIASLVGNIKRGLRLYIHYWITLAIFLPIAGYMLGFDKYPQNLHWLMLNMTGILTTYNGEIWFLFPYVQLVLFSWLFFKFTDKCHWSIVLVFGLALHVVQTMNHDFFYLFTRQIKPMFLPFLFGMLTAKMVDFGKMRAFFKGRVMLGYALLLGVCLLLMSLVAWILTPYYAHTVRPFFATTICILLACLPHTAIVDRVLMALGNRIASIWFIHSWFCYTLCHDFIYSFKYAIPIFIVLVLISYVCSIPIDYVHKRILRLVGLAKK